MVDMAPEDPSPLSSEHPQGMDPKPQKGKRGEGLRETECHAAKCQWQSNGGSMHERIQEWSIFGRKVTFLPLSSHHQEIVDTQKWIVDSTRYDCLKEDETRNCTGNVVANCTGLSDKRRKRWHDDEDGRD